MVDSSYFIKVVILKKGMAVFFSSNELLSLFLCKDKNLNYDNE